jgi:hemolysin III
MAEFREQTLPEEIANSITHGLGLVISLAMMPLLILTATRTHDIWRISSVSVYAATLVLLYSTSTLYHAMPGGRAKAVFQRLDHAAIYLLIAGTYTPFVLVPLRGPWGWSLFGVVWTLGIMGVVLKGTFGVRLPALSTAVYLAMGWMVVVGAGALAAHVPTRGVVWLIAGGLLYSGGVAFFVWERLRFSHALWHLCVLGGSGAHLAAVYWYVLPIARALS